MKAHATFGCTVLIMVFLCSMVLGQSSFLFSNRSAVGAVDAPVFDAQGVPLAGPNYLAELWGGATTDSLTPAVDLDRGAQRVIVPFSSGGYFGTFQSTPSVLGVLPGSSAWLQVRAWDARLGSMYEVVLAQGLGGYGESRLFFAQGGNPVAPNPTPPGPLIGLESFSLREVIPEPSAVLLLLLGLPLVLGRSRILRKSEKSR